MTTDIEWADETLNPQGWGCWGPGGTPEAPKRCWYCYSEDFAERHLSKCEKCNQFIPHWHPERLEIPFKWKKGKKIFWASMSDIFHPYTPTWQIEECLATAIGTPQHTHIFCTKNPARYRDFNPWPSNCWVGTTVTNQADADERLHWLGLVEARVIFASHEPLMGNIDILPHLRTSEYTPKIIDWAIIGAMTGPKAKIETLNQIHKLWLPDLLRQYRAARVPCFVKDNLHWPEKIQEWPR